MVEYEMSGEMLKTTVEELDKLINANTVMGDAVDAGDVVIIPIASFGFGFGSGEGSGGKCGEGDDGCRGAGAGAGGGVTPVAVVIIHKELKGHEGVQVLSLKKSGEIAEIISTIGAEVLPQVVDAVKGMTRNKEEEGAEIPVSGKEE